MYKLCTEGNGVIPVDNMIRATEGRPGCKYPKAPQCYIILNFPDFISSMFILIGKKENIVLLIF